MQFLSMTGKTRTQVIAATENSMHGNGDCWKNPDTFLTLFVGRPVEMESALLEKRLLRVVCSWSEETLADVTGADRVPAVSTMA